MLALAAEPIAIAIGLASGTDDSRFHAHPDPTGIGSVLHVPPVRATSRPNQSWYDVRVTLMELDTNDPARVVIETVGRAALVFYTEGRWVPFPDDNSTISLDDCRTPNIEDLSDAGGCGSIPRVDSPPRRRPMSQALE
jgi:hypothetical protein